MRQKFLVLLILLSFLTAPFLYARYRERQHLELAQTALQNLQEQTAILEFIQALSWRSFLSGQVSYTGQKAFELISNLEDPKARLQNLLELKSTLRSSRSFVQEEKTQDLFNQLESELKQTLSEPLAQSGQVTEILEREPNYKQQILAQLAFWGWLLSAFVAIWGVQFEELKGKVLVRRLILPVGFYLCWIVILA